VAPLYGYEGGGAQLQKMGCILGGALVGQKARVLLMVALGAGLEELVLKALFEAF
jgi:L-asparaginase